MDKLLVVIVGVLIFVLGVCAVGMLLAYPVMLLWNGCLVGAVDGVKEVGWLQTWGLIVLCGVLFKSTSSK